MFSIGMTQHLLSAYIAYRAMYNPEHMSVDIIDALDVVHRQWRFEK